MAFGMTARATNIDFIDIMKYDANAGRLFRIDYDMSTREKIPVDITVPPPRFAIDFGTLEVGWASFSASGPEYRMVPEGKPLPPEPTDLDDKGRPKFRSAFRVKVFGKVLSGLREWSSAAECVLTAVEDVYKKFQAAEEAKAGKIPIIEMSRVIPIVLGKGARQRTVYSPCFLIVGWTERVPDMGERTVPILVPEAATAGQIQKDLDDEIPF
jgi:hypothetical protein